jgi:hypothetical protein
MYVEWTMRECPVEEVISVAVYMSFGATKTGCSSFK